MKKIILACSTMLLSAFVYAVNVSTAEDFAANIAADPTGSYTLTSNIDCSDWVSVASFTGSIDGAGYEIQNLKVPMFDTVGGSGTFSNIVFKDACITSKVANASVGVLANKFDGENFQLFNLSFDGCSIISAAKSNTIGMLAGELTVSGIISNCVVKSTCTLSGSSNISIGGLIGKASSSGAESSICFVKCENAAEVIFGNATHMFGGITVNAETKGASGKFAYIRFEDCTNRTSIVAKKTNCGFGGITYWSSAYSSSAMGEVSFVRCVNYGSAIFSGGASSPCRIGGIAGDSNKGKFVFDSCINYGTLASTNVEEQRSTAGGIVATVSAPIKQPFRITNCANLGDVSGYYAGGIVGSVSHNASYSSTRWYINSCIQKGVVTCRAITSEPGQVIGSLISSVKYPEFDFSGSLFQSDLLIGEYFEGAETTSILTNACVFASTSNYLVDGKDLATLNAYNDCNLWKQGSTSPILKIMDDEPAPDIITVTFKDADSFDSSVIATYSISRGSSVIPPVNPEHEGYTFIKWSLDDFSNLTEDTEIVATYLAGSLEYTVRFLDWDGGVIGEPQLVEYGNAAIAPVNPNRDGYVFVGWEGDYSAVFSDVDVYAKYVVANIDITTSEEFVLSLSENCVPGVTYHLKDNIVLPSDWVSIDLVANIDGGGYTISNYSGVPLFSVVYGNVSNLILDGYNSETMAATEVKISGDYKTFGVLADVLDGGTVSDVIVRNYTINSGRYTTMGALVATMRNGATLYRVHIEESCVINLKQSFAGGIVGKFNRTEDFSPKNELGYDLEGAILVGIYDSTNSAPIIITGGGNAVAGGIVGDANIANSTYKFEMVISNCVNTASISPQKDLVVDSEFCLGGFVGERDFNLTGNAGVLKIIDSSNYGDISAIGGESSYGGFIGHTYRAAKTQFIRCQNRGNIGGLVRENGEALMVGYAAGFIGIVSDLYVGNPFDFVDCANYGDIACGKYAGGFLSYVAGNGGHHLALSMVNCANYGTISINDTVNGAAGQTFAAFDTDMSFGSFTLTISNCLLTSSDVYGRIMEQSKEGKIIETVELNHTYVDDNKIIKATVKALDGIAQEQGYEPWVLGVVDNNVYPELECFAERIFSLETLIIIK